MPGPSWPNCRCRRTHADASGIARTPGPTNLRECLAILSRLRGASAHRSGGRLRRAGHRVDRQAQREHRAALRAVFRADVAAVLFGDLLDDGEAEAGALALARRVRLE